jgi:hypothetical protein
MSKQLHLLTCLTSLSFLEHRRRATNVVLLQKEKESGAQLKSQVTLIGSSSK